jgi:hypothetical protein
MSLVLKEQMELTEPKELKVSKVYGVRKEIQEISGQWVCKARWAFLVAPVHKVRMVILELQGRKVPLGRLEQPDHKGRLE